RRVQFDPIPCNACIVVDHIVKPRDCFARVNTSRRLMIIAASFCPFIKTQTSGSPGSKFGIVIVTPLPFSKNFSPAFSASLVILPKTDLFSGPIGPSGVRLNGKTLICPSPLQYLASPSNPSSGFDSPVGAFFTTPDRSFNPSTPGQDTSL